MRAPVTRNSLAWSASLKNREVPKAAQNTSRSDLDKAHALAVRVWRCRNPARCELENWREREDAGEIVETFLRKGQIVFGEPRQFRLVADDNGYVDAVFLPGRASVNDSNRGERNVRLPA